MSNFSKNILDNENTTDKSKLNRKIDMVMQDLTSEERALAISSKCRRRSVTGCTLITSDLSNYVFDDENITELIDTSEDDSDESDYEYKIYLQKPAKRLKIITNADEIA
ncbi:hypothetical protein TSAR_011484 [Trichomalopsis sarcophagae]|uniref:Uncharacterized protein n=1 Tax=Trichomalopsis sarcophagae TaxID=543379 RepID=A0A232F164_9HYME|nr:hypothetical protein TSAR_011484 [Trichomalopsis sarcophagae]